MNNYFLHVHGMNEEVKVWAQMLFSDGSVTQGKYVSRHIYEDEEDIKTLAKEFLLDTGRKEGVLLIWGAGRVIAKRCLLATFKGSQTLRLRRL